MPSAAHHDLARWAGHHFLKCKPQFFFPNIGNRCVFFYLHKHQKEHDTAHGRTLSVVSHLSSRFPTFLLENLASSPVLRLPFVFSFSVSQSDCSIFFFSFMVLSICWLTCQRAMACLVFSIDCSTIPSTGVLWRQHKVWRYGWWRCGHRLHRAYATKSRWQQRKTVHRPIICRNSRKSFSCLWYRPRQFSQ